MEQWSNPPIFGHVTVATEAAAQTARNGGLVVVKPTCGSGSLNVKLCRTPQEAHVHATNLLEELPGRPILVESLALGAEYSVELFDGAVCGIVKKYLGPKPHFVETGHDYPARVAPKLAQRIGRFAQDCADALGITWGPAHVEVRTDGEQIHLIEVNPRLAGGFIPLMIRAATGLDLIEVTILKAVGAMFSLTPERCGNASLRFIVPGRNGVLSQVEGFDGVSKMPGVVSAELYRKVPFDFQRKCDFRDRIGHILATGSDQDTALSAVDKAMSQIVIRFSEGLAKRANFLEE